MEVSVLLPFVPRRPEQVLPFAGLIKWTRAARLWQGQSTVIEPFHGFAHSSGAGFRVPTGIGVALMPLRHPFDAAQMAHSAVLTSGEPMRIAVGPGAAAFQKAMLGASYASPLTAAREYVAIMRGLLDGDQVDFAGRYYQCHFGLHPMPAPRVEVGLGVLRPKMAHLAGEIAENVVTWLTSPAYLEGTICPAIKEGAATASQRAPSVTTFVPVGLYRPGRNAQELALESARAHLQGPHYIDMLAKAGIQVSGRPTLEDAQKLIDGGVFLYGRPDRIGRGLDAYAAAGVDEIVLNLTGTCALHGLRATVQDLEVLLTHLPQLREQPLSSKPTGSIIPRSTEEKLS